MKTGERKALVHTAAYEPNVAIVMDERSKSTVKHRPEYDNKVIGRNLKYFREKKHLSVDYVREYLRLGTPQAVYKWEAGKGYPQTDTMFALLQLYEIEIKDILYDRKEDPTGSSFNIFGILWMGGLHTKLNYKFNDTKKAVC